MTNLGFRLASFPANPISKPPLPDLPLPGPAVAGGAARLGLLHGLHVGRHASDSGRESEAKQGRGKPQNALGTPFGFMKNQRHKVAGWCS